MTITDYVLQKVNAARRRKNKPELSRHQAQQAITTRADGTDHMDFLIGYATGIPTPTSAGVMGAMMHPSAPDSAPSIDSSVHESGGAADISGGGDSGGGGGGGGC